MTATANGTAGSYSVTASANGLASVSFALTNNPPPNLVVNETGDDTGNASDCSAQPTAGTTTNSDSCTLRDALASASVAGAGNITFDNTVFATAQTIMLANGTLTIPNNTTITGPTAAGAVSANNPQGNLVTVDGTNLTNLSIFAINSGSTAAIANLVVQSEYSGFGGSASSCIENQGAFSFTNSALLNCQTDSSNSSLDNTGTLTVTGSTFANDSDGILNEVGATATVTGSTFATIYQHFRNYGTATISYSTFKGSFGFVQGGTVGTYGSGAETTLLNSTVYGTTITHGKTATPTAGAVYVAGGGTLNLGNSIVYGNTYSGGGSTVPSDVLVASGSTLNDLGGNYIGTETGATTTTLNSAPVNLSAFGSQGGNGMAVLLPLPGSPAICAGVAANIPNGATTDQRGLPNKNITYTGYSAGTPCVDAGAVQTAYALKFDQQPSSVVQNLAMAPAPTVELDENGKAFADGTDTVSIPLALTTGAGTLSGSPASTSASTGIATYSALSIDTLGTGDVLTASLALNPAIATNPPTLTKASNTFNVNSAVTQLAFSTAPASTVTAGGNAGAAIIVHEEDVNGTLVTTAGDSITLTVTGPNSYSQSYTQTATAGVATFDLSGDALTAAGNYIYSAAITGNGTVTPATASETLNSAAAATVSVISGSGQSAVIGAAFASPLAVKVVDPYNNVVPGATVVFTAPASAASASLSTPAVTAADGTTSVTATANGTASAAAYTVTASASGATASASFSLTNNQHSTSLTVAPSSLALVYGQPVTVNASITPASVLTSAPTGAVTFYDGAAALAPTSTVASAAASYAIAVPTVGSHLYAAQYAGDTNFQPSSKTSATGALVVSPASSTLHGPASESFTYGTGGSFAITVSGQYSGAGIATPSGSVTYIIGGGTPQTAVLTAGSATLTIPSTQSAGNSIVAISYLGDGNYNAATSINVPVTVKQATATISVTPYNVTYDGLVHTATGTANGVGGANLAADLTLSGTAHTAAGAYATDAWSFHDPAGNYADASGTVSDHIGTATLNVAASSFSKVYGTANPAFSGSISGQQPGDTFTESFSTAATLSSPVGSYPIVPSVTGANLSDYTQAITDGTLTVTQAASMTTLQLSSTSITPGQSVTLRATVANASAGSTGMPTGAVNFYDNGVLLSATPVTGGVATYSTTSLTPGVSNAITATYSGDTNFTASSSAASTAASITVAPLDFTMTLTNPSNLTVAPGQSVSFQVHFTPMYGSYAGTVSFAMTGLPTGSTVSFSPSSLAADGGPQTVTVTITTAPATAQLYSLPPPLSGRNAAPFALASLLLFGTGRLRKRGKALRGLLCVLLVAGAGLLATGLSGCGSNAGFFTQTPKNYNVTMTATAANVQQSISINLNVQ